jgi:Ca2+-binding EF-hand superfamily protein
MTKTFLFAALLTATLAAPSEAQMFGGGDAMDPFANADANGDGMITRAEFLAARSARFAKMDRNGDGAVARDDFGRLLKLRPKAGERIDALIEQMDKNGDGRVSREEFTNTPPILFDRADANGDGKVDKAELAAAKQLLETLKARRKG